MPECVNAFGLSGVLWLVNMGAPEIKVNNDCDVLALLEQAGQDALNAPGAEAAIEVLMKACHARLGDHNAHMKEGALKPGEQNIFVAGAFFVTPDERFHMLVGGIGFPSEQKRLLVPIDGGHPGIVYATKKKLILRNTDEHPEFRQYLKTARMGATIFAPLIWQGKFIGQIIMAAQARNALRDEDLSALVAVSRVATAVWIAQSGPAWMQQAYPPVDAFYVDIAGLK